MSITKDAEKKEIDEVWEEYLKTQDTDLRDKLIVHYLFIIKWVVARMGNTLPGYIKLDDLYSSGVTGLIKAVEKFDTAKNNKFETYAVVVIKGAIIDELRRLDWIPRSIHRQANQIATASEKLSQKLGRDPTESEISEHLGLTDEEYENLLARVRPAILIPLNADVMMQDEETMSIADKIADVRAQTSYEAADRKEFSSMLENAINDLPEQEKKVLILYYYEELMLKEIGRIIGVSESRVSQIHTKALLKLRSKLKEFMSHVSSAFFS